MTKYTYSLQNFKGIYSFEISYPITYKIKFCDTKFNFMTIYYLIIKKIYLRYFLSLFFINRDKDQYILPLYMFL